MRVSVSQVHGYAVFTLGEEPERESEMAAVVKLVEDALAQGKRGVAISFGTDTFLLSRMISVLVHCSFRAKRYGAEFAVVAQNPRVLEVLRTVGLTQRMRVCSSLSELGAAGRQE